MIHRVEPVYPASLAERAPDGQAEVSFVVDERGCPVDLKIKRASEPAFGEAVVAAVASWTYEPFTHNGRPVRSRRITEKFQFQPPWSMKLEVLCGRKVFVELASPVVEEARLDAPLRLVAHWKPEGPKWIKIDRAADRTITITFVVSADGQVLNPMIETGAGSVEAFAAVYTLAFARWDPPTHGGQPANVRVLRALTMKVGSRQWALPDDIVKSAAVESFEPGARDAGGETDRRPVVIKRVDPEYPRALRLKGARALVEVEFVVTSRGEVADARIYRSTDPAFNDLALAAIRQWQFEPGMKSGRAVNTLMRQTMAFDVHQE